MSTSCVRFEKVDIPYDVLNSDAKLLNFGVGGVEARFPANANNAAGWFKRNGYVVNAQDSLSMAFNSTFTIMFWAKFVDKLTTDDVYGNNWILILDDGSIISVQIPVWVTTTNWNHYSIVRDVDNIITMRINGTSVKTSTNSATFDLSNSSYMYLGNTNRYTVGYEVIADDILIFDGALYDGDFIALPDDYIDVSSFRQLLYIITSTGEVWGYAQAIGWIITPSAIASLGLSATNSSTGSSSVSSITMSSPSSFQSGYLSESSQISGNFTNLVVFGSYNIYPMYINEIGMQYRNLSDTVSRSSSSISMTSPSSFEGGYYSESSVINANLAIGVDVM